MSRTASLLPLVLVALALAGCAQATPGDDPSMTSAPPNPTVTPTGSTPTFVTGPEAQQRILEIPTPVPSGPVLGTGVVLQQPDGPPMLCIGGIAESYPPLCEGPELVGWDWTAAQYEEASGVRWSVPLAVRVTADAPVLGDPSTAVTLVEVLDLAALTLPSWTPAVGSISPEAQELLMADFDVAHRPDMLSWGSGDGAVEYVVVYDDGSIQAAFDEIYAPGVVDVRSALTP